MNSKIIQGIISILVLFSFMFGAYLFIDNRYAKSEEVYKIEQRLDYWITYDQYMSVQERIWKLEDKYGSIKNMPDDIKEQYRRLVEERKRLETKLNSYNK